MIRYVLCRPLGHEIHFCTWFFCKDVHPNGIHVLYHWQTLGQPYLRSPLQCHSPIWASTCFRCSNQFTMLVLHTMFVAMCLHETALTISQVTMDPQGGKMLIMAPIPTGSKDMIPIFGNHVWWARMHPWPWQRVAQKEVLKRCACQLKEVLAIHLYGLYDMIPSFRNHIIEPVCTRWPCLASASTAIWAKKVFFFIQPLHWWRFSWGAAGSQCQLEASLALAKLNLVNAR